MRRANATHPGLAGLQQLRGRPREERAVDRQQSRHLAPGRRI
jgi:hypothetical protein